MDETKWILLASLLDCGYSIDTCLKIMNIKNIDLKKYIDNGYRIEDVILQGQKGKFYSHLSFFVQFMSLSKAIYCSFQMNEFERNSIKNIYKKCAYPIFIFCISMISIFLFSNYIIPQLIINFENIDRSIFINVVNITKYICIVLIFIFFLVLIIICYAKVSFRFYNFLHKKWLYHIPLFNSYISYFLSGYMKELNNHGLSSLQSFIYLSKLEENRSLSLVVNSINEDLYSGKELNEIIVSNVYLDNDFKMYFGIGYKNGNLNDSLSAYIKSTEIKWERQISTLSLSITVLSYSFVGVLLICVYQIMLIPLDLLNQL